MGIVLYEDDKEKLNFLNDALLASWSSGKATYATWILYVNIEKGKK